MKRRIGGERCSNEIPDGDYERILRVQIHAVGAVRTDRVVGVADVQRDLTKLSIKRLIDLAAADQIGADTAEGA